MQTVPSAVSITKEKRAHRLEDERPDIPKPTSSLNGSYPDPALKLVGLNPFNSFGRPIVLSRSTASK
jgi:hypothetical protein